MTKKIEEKIYKKVEQALNIEEVKLNMNEMIKKG